MAKDPSGWRWCCAILGVFSISVAFDVVDHDTLFPLCLNWSFLEIPKELLTMVGKCLLLMAKSFMSMAMNTRQLALAHV